MTELEKYKLALFGVVRNSMVMPNGLRMGKSMDEIEKMSVETMESVIKMIDFEVMKRNYEVGRKLAEAK